MLDIQRKVQITGLKALRRFIPQESGLEGMKIPVRNALRLILLSGKKLWNESIKKKKRQKGISVFRMGFFQPGFAVNAETVPYRGCAMRRWAAIL